ncbi:LOW QUALITY PROTEIN: uncharacterized protein At1g01500-like [Carica papaya]|uniref:LOW QUALITY PROTEIN: uncharacterized protein At1g01500-like n=1 Tax=Carica papaya TaxID=3649 RepID=UPI000B8CC22D|nr:LOW QUALITY PROTEIN: uncharacterized protein At1g01500-like [Carica papaya]
MDHKEPDPLPRPFPIKTGKSYHLMDGPALSLSQSTKLEIRFFYVRIAPCVIGSVPDYLTLCHPCRATGMSLEINGSLVHASDAASIVLRRERLDRESSEVTYVCTDAMRVTGGFEFEVYGNNDLLLCGSLERMEGTWSNRSVGDEKTGWDMDCYMAVGNGSGSGSGSGSAFFQPKLGISSTSIEVYIAGCCGGVPVILTKTIQLSPRKKSSRLATLDAIPEDREVGNDHKGGGGANRLVRNRKFQFMETEVDYESGGKIGNSYLSEDAYTEEDGELPWFNSGVRFGVGVGLGICIGFGIGVGLLMRSYQATTRNFRRRLF